MSKVTIIASTKDLKEELILTPRYLQTYGII